MVALRKYTWIGITSARSNLAYFGEVAARVLFLSVILYIFLRLWQVTYSQTGSAQLGGFTLAQMMWYLAMTESITLSVPRVNTQIDEDVRTGALAVQLLRPMYYPLYRLWTTMGERVVRFGLNATVAIAIVWFFVGPIPFTAEGLALFALSLPMAFILDFLAQFLVGVAAFWLEDTSGIYLIYSRMLMVLGGMLIPLELFPDSLQPILRAIPFSSMVYGPARLFVQPTMAFFTDVMLRQGITILILSLIVVLVYRVAVRRINANGG